jgi:histidinol-phosphate/aromatic aminotransferase/cobyric acid decarboxylase-like protein
VNALTQAAIAEALKIGDGDIAQRREMVIRERQRLADALRELPVEAPETQANFIWMRAEGMRGAELAEQLEEKRVHVAPGGPLGDDDHVRAAIRDSRATERLIAALRQVLAGSPA